MELRAARLREADQEAALESALEEAHAATEQASQLQQVKYSTFVLLRQSCYDVGLRHWKLDGAMFVASWGVPWCC